MTPAEFRAIRLALGLSRAQLALKLGCSERAISHWEIGDRRIRSSIAKLLTFMRNGHEQ